jgi:hypothetical protein
MRLCVGLRLTLWIERCAFVCIVYCPLVAFWEDPHSSSMPSSCGIFCYRITFTTCFSGHISRSISRFRLLVDFLLNSLARWRSPDWDAFLVRGIHGYSSFLAIFMHLLVYGGAKLAVGNFCNILLISCSLHIRTIFQLHRFQCIFLRIGWWSSIAIDMMASFLISLSDLLPIFVAVGDLISPHASSFRLLWTVIWTVICACWSAECDPLRLTLITSVFHRHLHCVSVMLTCMFHY